ncbi:hypothetical protein B9Z19DRAFT_545832 [Tuber borchii]|uniref:Uncharacterized protein n=1 Tax=Tuber borchii TaxID=42251 RepID=A0A2T6ZD89_TUBBO|nr:hypothetical protein B9Z19DRAFT_545832 [Tuber borchii]
MDFNHAQRAGVVTADELLRIVSLICAASKLDPDTISIVTYLFALYLFFYRRLFFLTACSKTYIFYYLYFSSLIRGFLTISLVS